MKKISQAIRQLDGDLLIKPDTQALLYRTLQDLYLRMAADEVDPESEQFRALAALRQAFGDYGAEPPAVNEMLGDPERDRVARNLLKG